jgi:hypothetical protein
VDRTVINAAAAPKLRLLRQSGPRMVEIRSRSIITDAADGADGVMQLVLAYGRYLLLKAILTCYKDADSRCRHEIFGDIPQVATSLISVENFLGTLKGSASGDITRERAVSFGDRDDDRLAGPRVFFT